MSCRVLSFCLLAALYARPVLAAPQPLSDAQRSALYSGEEDKLDKPVCVGTRKRVTLKCRDVRHYVRMNEWYHDIWRPYVNGIGGGYMGIASDQNLTFIAWAKSEYAWLMDYDPVVVRVNWIHRAFALAAADRKTFRNYWKKGHRAEVESILDKTYPNHPELKAMKRVYRVYRREVDGHFKRVLRIKRHIHWLQNDDDYAYVRKMYQTDRIRVMKGDLLKAKSVRTIGAAAKKLGIPVRIVYLSNAEEFWPYPKNFKQNFIEMPMDEKSVVLRTRHTKKYGPKIGSYIYVVQSGKHFADKLKEKGTRGVWTMLRDRKPGRPGFFTIGTPVRPESMPKKKGRKKQAAN